MSAQSQVSVDAQDIIVVVDDDRFYLRSKEAITHVYTLVTTIML